MIGHGFNFELQGALSGSIADHGATRLRPSLERRERWARRGYFGAPSGRALPPAFLRGGMLFGMSVSLIFLVAFTFCRAVEVPPPLTEPGPLVELGGANADWQPLFEKLAAQGNVFSHFTENRWFPFKKIPVVLKGEMRLAGGHGMSLRYTQPEDRTMIVDERGLLLRDDRGHSREVPPDPRSGNINAALLPVLRFDQVALAKSFLMHAVRSGNSWRLDFEPRDAALAKIVGRIIVWGEEAKVEQLEFRRSNSQRVEIIIDDSQAGVVFSAEDLKRFFR